MYFAGKCTGAGGEMTLTDEQIKRFKVIVKNHMDSCRPVQAIMIMQLMDYAEKGFIDAEVALGVADGSHPSFDTSVEVIRCPE
jgi:hypothetical protein